MGDWLLEAATAYNRDSYEQRDRYATHLLIDAEKAGYPVPREAIEDAVDWLSSEVEGSANDSSAYVHYVLALAGEGRKGEMLQLVE